MKLSYQIQSPKPEIQNAGSSFWLRYLFDRVLLNPGLYAGVLIAVILVMAAYQDRPSYDIPFGTATDGPLLTGFNAGERSQGDNPFTFRWSTGRASITLSDVGRQDFDVVMTMAAPRPSGSAAPRVVISVGPRRVLDMTVPGEIKDYTFHVSRDDLPGGSLPVNIRTDTFSPPGDPRELGIIVKELKVSPGSAPDVFIEPTRGPVLSITIAALIVGFAFALLGWGPGGTALGGACVGGLAAWLISADRLWLTTGAWYRDWVTALVAGGIFAALAWLLTGWLLRVAGRPWSGLERRLLLTLALLVFAVRLAGQLHPQIYIVDLMFHAHRFDTVRSGQLLFTIQSAEWGGHETFYLPTAYIFMLPLQWLLDNELFVIKLFTVALSTLGAFPVFYIARKTLRDGRAGLIAAALYLTVPLAVLPFSWGITTNIFGEFFALLALAALVTGYNGLSAARPAFWLLLFALLMALLSHPGVVQLTGLAFTLIILLWLLPGGTIAGRRGALWALGGLAAAALVAYFGYYTHFAAQMLDTLRQMQAERAAASGGGLNLKIGGSVADKSLGLIVRTVNNRADWFFGGLRGFWQEAQAYYRVWPVAGSVLGLLFVSPVGRLGSLPGAGGRRLLVRASVAWWLTVLLFLVVGWVMNLYVRYALFALPVIALGAGALLSPLWRRGRAGALLTVMMLVFFAAEALALWQFRITYAFK